MRRIVELAAASLPWAIRDRHLEEWLHDLEHADEAGVRRSDIAWGAVRTAITADRMQAPSIAHAILQARLRIDSAGTHGTIAMMQLILLFITSAGHGVGVPIIIGALLGLAAIIHSVIVVVQLHLAWSVIGGVFRLSAALWGLGILLATVALALALAGVDQWWFATWPAGACLAASSILSDARKPPKPELRHHVRPGSRRRLLLIGGGAGALTIAFAVVDATVLAPRHWASAVAPEAAWVSIGASGGPSSPLTAGIQLTAIMLVPIALGLLVAGRWARSERAILGWVSAPALLAAFVAYFYATWLGTLPVATTAAPYVILPLVAAALMELVYRGLPRLAPLPPASVPLPPGPWHVELDVPDRGHVAG